MPRYWVDDPDDDFDYDSLNLDEPSEIVPFEEWVERYRIKFGQEPKIKDPRAFALSASFDFEFGLEDAVELENEPTNRSTKLDL